MEKEKIIYEYCLLRYVPDIERGEFLNVGLMMMSKRFRWMRCSLHLDDDRIQAGLRNVDMKRLAIQLDLFERNDVPAKDLSVEERYRWLAAVKSAVIQTSPSHPGIIPVPVGTSRPEAVSLLEEKFNSLFGRLVK